MTEPQPDTADLGDLPPLPGLTDPPVEVSASPTQDPTEAPPQPGDEVTVLELTAPPRSDGQPLCDYPTLPLPASPAIWLQLNCAHVQGHEGPHMWSWIWTDREEGGDAAAGS